MASKTTVELIDDLDGSTATSTVKFSLDGKEREIDLSDANAAELRGALEKFLEAGRPVSAAKSAKGSTRKSSGGGKGSADKQRNDAIRTWARANGHPDLKDRGRLPGGVEDAWVAAGSPGAPTEQPMAVQDVATAAPVADPAATPAATPQFSG